MFSTITRHGNKQLAKKSISNILNKNKLEEEDGQMAHPRVHAALT